jgi:S-formylglutathione hydrolase FrmB
MAFLDVHCFSETLAMSVSFYVLLPEGPVRRPYPTLYLLHGLSDDHTIWLRRTSIERYAAARNLAVVMPAVARSFYQDMASGPRYWTFLSDELPTLCRQWFPLSEDREDNFAAGLSMGGYGALRLALSQPNRFAAAASLSGALDLSRRLREAGREGSRVSRAEWEGIFGCELASEGTDADLFALARKIAESKGPKPKLFVCCGTEDPLLEESRAFRKHLDAVNLPNIYKESRGQHEWSYWDSQIQRVLDWLPLDH